MCAIGYLHENIQVFKGERISGPEEGHYYTNTPTDMLLHVNELSKCKTQTQKG